MLSEDLLELYIKTIVSKFVLDKIISTQAFYTYI